MTDQNRQLSHHLALPKHIEFIQSLACDIFGNLSNSSAQSLTVQELVNLSGNNIDNFLDLPLNYASIKGCPILRKLIVNFHQKLNLHQTKLSFDNVLTFCGAQEALSALYQFILQSKEATRAGENVIVVSPNYPSLTIMAQHRGYEVRGIRLSENQKWQLTIDDFKANVDNNTRLIVLNSPHNPSGQVIETELADEILALAKSFDCYLIIDDVSQATNYNDLSLAHHFLDYEKAFVVSVMSKSFGLAGLRLGWVVSQNQKALESLLIIKSYQSICCSVVDEALAKLAFITSEKIIKNNNCVVIDNIMYFQRFVEQHSQLLSWHKPQAGLLAIVEYKLSEPIEDFAKKLAQATGILILPTSLFGLPGNYFRLGLGQKNFKSILDKFSQFIEEIELNTKI